MSLRALDLRWKALVAGWSPAADPGVVERIATQLDDLRVQWRRDAERAVEEGTLPADVEHPEDEDREPAEPPDGTFDPGGLRELLAALADAGEPDLPEELDPGVWLDPDARSAGDLGPEAALFVPIAVWSGFTFLGRDLGDAGTTPWARLVPLFFRIAQVLDDPDPDPYALEALDEALEYPLGDDG
ncbi:MAG: hypothetical protein ABMB14_24400 [Myxococcota bacterium]